LLAKLQWKWDVAVAMFGGCEDEEVALHSISTKVKIDADYSLFR
jgi:hypothetical protein